MIRRLLTIAVALTAVLFAGCGDDTADTPAGTATTAPRAAEVILDWYANADHAGLLGAVDQGFFARRGLDVTTTVPTDPAASLKQVAAGKAPFAISYAPEVLIARSQGIPVTAVAALIPIPLNSVMARADRGITRPRDLEGKTVGAAGVPSDRALLDTVVRSDGGDPAKVTLRNVGFNLAPSLAAGKVDAVIGAYWNIEQPELEAKGVKLNVLRLEEHGVPMYAELVIVTSDTVAKDDPQLVRDFVAGLAEGQAWAAGNPDAAAAALLKANPDLSADTLGAQLALTAPLLATDGVPAVAVLPQQWADLATWMRENGLLTGDGDVAAAVNDTFVPAP